MHKHTPTKNSANNINRYSDGKILHLYKMQLLGSGSFGSAFKAKHPDYPKGVVLKDIDLQAKGKYIHFSTYHLLRLAYREIMYLQKLNYLIGYEYDAQNNKMRILMRRIQGKPEFELDLKNLKKYEFASFSALMRLHRLGIAHMDPHKNNFIYQAKTNKSYAIDFGLAQDYQMYRGLRDIYLFLRMRKTKSDWICMRRLDFFSFLAAFYYQDLKNYIRHHRWEIAQRWLCIGAILTVGIAGNPLVMSTLIAHAFFRSWVIQGLSELLETLQDHYEMRAWNQKNDLSVRVLYGYLCTLLALFQACLFVGTCSLINLTNPFVLKDLFSLLIMVPTLSHSLKYWFNNAEKYLLSPKMLCFQYEMTLAINQPKAKQQPQLEPSKKYHLKRA